MTVLAWTVGGLLLVGGGLWPFRHSLRRVISRPTAPSVSSDLDQARSSLSRLDTALELAAPTLDAHTRAAVERCRLLAGAALGGSPDPAACRRSSGWSHSGLKLLGSS